MSYHRGGLVAGIFFVLMGVVFLLDAVGAWHLRPVHVWPLLLIGLGLAVLAGGMGGDRRDSEER